MTMTINPQTLQGAWHELRGKLKEKWGQLTDDDLRTFDGNTEQLVGLIQRKTGAARGSIEQFLSQAASAEDNLLNQAYSAVEEGVSQVSETVQQHYRDAEKLVRKRPTQALLVTFGVGVAAGAGLALFLHSRSYGSYWPRNRSQLEYVGHHLLHTLARMLPA